MNICVVFSLGLCALAYLLFGEHLPPFLLGIYWGVYLFGHRIGSCLVLVDTSQKFPRVVVQIIPPTSDENECHLSAYVVNCYNTSEWQVWVSPPPVHRGACWVPTNLVKAVASQWWWEPEVRTLPPEWQQVLNYHRVSWIQGNQALLWVCWGLGMAAWERSGYMHRLGDVCGHCFSALPLTPHVSPGKWLDLSMPRFSCL